MLFWSSLTEDMGFGKMLLILVQNSSSLLHGCEGVQQRNVALS